jgi:hypothetical protein
VPLTLIIRGYGFARRTSVDGQQLVSGVAPAGTLFGFSGIASTESSVELVALTTCDVAQWPGPEFRDLVAVDPAVALGEIDSMAASLPPRCSLLRDSFTRMHAAECFGSWRVIATCSSATHRFSHGPISPVLWEQAGR